MKRFGLFLITLLSSHVSISQQQHGERLSSFTEKILASAPQIPGISIVVVNADSILYAEGYGLADAEKNLKATEQTGFYIASTTKPFVALLATILANNGKIDLQKSITEYAPFKNFKDNSVFRDVTVHDLLTHQSGIDNSMLSIKLAYSGDYTRDMILNLTEQYTIANEKGKAFEYSNFGYYLFSILLQEELGLDWRNLLSEYIFQPLNMVNTSAYISVASKNVLAMPYNGIVSEKPERAYLMKEDDTMHAAGGIVSSAADIGQWLIFQLNEGKYNSVQRYPAAVLQQTHQQQAANDHNFSDIFKGTGYSLGWRTGSFKENSLIYHFGGYTGFFAHLSFLPEKNLGVAVLVNHELGSVPGNLIAEYAYDLFLGNTGDLKKHEQYATSKLPALIKKQKNAELKSRENFAKRQWQLSLSRNAYTGTYVNPELGTVVVTLESDDLHVSFGHLKAVATPIELSECIRLELIPGEGIAIKFIVEDNQATAIRYNGKNFTRVR